MALKILLFAFLSVVLIFMILAMIPRLYSFSIQSLMDALEIYVQIPLWEMLREILGFVGSTSRQIPKF